MKTLFILSFVLYFATSFTCHPSISLSPRAKVATFRGLTEKTVLYAGNDKISKDRRKQLGISDDEDEYDLGVALAQNTDPLISKIIAGSFILVMIALLTVGLIIPSLTDYGEGVCNPILTQGRC